MPSKKKPPAKKGKPAGSSQEKPKKGINHKAAERREVFVREYLVDLNGTAAAIRAGYSKKSAAYSARDLLLRPDVKSAIEAAKAARIQRIEMTGDDVLRQIIDIVTADPRELMELRRGACRYCYGKNHRYQRTPREMDDAKTQYELLAAEALKKDPKAVLAPFNSEGGIGWDPRKTPNNDCPECFGQGEQQVYFKDTRDLSPRAAMLFAGVKQTQHGLEIKVHDQSAMRVKLGEHFGLFTKKVQLTGAEGGPVEIKQILADIDGSETGL